MSYTVNAEKLSQNEDLDISKYDR